MNQLTTTQPTLPTPPAHGQIWPGQGGHYICTLPALLGLPARHLIASATETKASYGPYTDIPAAKSPIDGPGNTSALLASAQAHPAAQWCRELRADGHADFHLPSKLDLVMAQICAPELFSKAGWHWTSTQYSRDSAFVQEFEYGDSNWYYKGYEHRVRAFRWIYLTP